MPGIPDDEDVQPASRSAEAWLLGHHMRYGK